MLQNEKPPKIGDLVDNKAEVADNCTVFRKKPQGSVLNNNTEI